jgi:hypothetical protein
MKTVAEMAREAGFELRRGWWVRDQVPEDVFAASVNITREIEAFAALVRADERNSWPAEMEAMERQVNILTDALAEERNECAKVCEELVPDMSRTANDASVWDVATFDCAAAIRARGSNT